MDTRRFRNFVRIVDLGSLSRAASHLGIAQPALSNMIAALERDFSAPLLIRSPQGVKPTEAGQRLYRHCQVILRQLEQAHEDVSTATTEVSGAVSIGLPVSTASVLSVPLLQAVHAAMPGVRLQIWSLPSGLIMEHVLNGRLDLALMFTEGEVKGIKQQPLVTEDLFLATQAVPGEAPPIADQRLLVSLPLLLPSQPHAIRVLVDQAFQATSQKPNVLAEMDSLPSIRASVRAGLAGTILSWSALQVEGETVGLHLQRIEGLNLSRTISLCWSDLLPTTTAARAVKAKLVGVIDEMIASAAWHGVEPV